MGTTKGKKRVTFLLDAPNARQVAVCGDFNHWEIEKHPMKKNDEGLWQKVLMLDSGRYEYKFYVDTEWRCDPANPSRCANTFGTANSVVFVKP
ncbi:MAG: glycogen-binding domain-containing protein [Thermodesulfobacteriota bacterium]